MTNSKNITATKGRLTEGIVKVVNSVFKAKNYDQKITDAVNKAKLQTGCVTRFYHYLDKAQVKLDQEKKTVMCKVMHRFGGGLIDFYTPSADNMAYCDKLKEPYYVPRGELHCVVLSIRDSDSDEYIIIGYYENEELIGINPAKPGNFKITTRGGHNQYWIKFGGDGLDLRLPSNATTKVGSTDAEMEEQEETYSKSEIDEIITSYETRIKTLEDKINELTTDGG